MTTFLAGPSALRAIRIRRHERQSIPAASPYTSTLSLKAPSIAELEMLYRMLGSLEPIYCLVGRSEFRRRAARARLVAHRSPLPRGSRIDLDEALAMSSPEHLFLQMHQWLDDRACIALGFELCGTYARHGTDAVTYHLPSVTTARKLQRYLARARKLRYAGRAIANARHIVDGSRSIRETQLAMYLGLPTRMGGAGLGGLVLNAPIDVSELTGLQWRDDLRWTDISWPGKKVAVEYDSTEWHSGIQKIAQDAARRTLLQAAGYDVVVVTNEQFKRLHELDRIVAVIHRLLGKRMRCRAKEYELKKRQLHQAILRLS